MTPLFTFLIVVKESGFAAAARKLSISTAAVSKQISQLEKELGLTLLKRSTRKIELTELGRQVYEQAIIISNEYGNLKDLASQSTSEPQGLLNVLCPKSYAGLFVVPYLPLFLKKYPKILLNLEVSERTPDLSLEKIDLMIGTSIQADETIIHKKIGVTQYVLCASPKYLEKKPLLKLNSIYEHRYITHSIRKPDNVIFFKEKEIVLDPYLKINDIETMVNCALNHVGIINVHRYVVNSYLKNGTLVEVLSNYHQSPVNLYLYYAPKKFLPSSVRAFIDYFATKFRE